MINRTLKHARQQLALRALAAADAKTQPQRHTAQRLERAQRRRLVEALRLADLES